MALYITAITVTQFFSSLRYLKSFMELIMADGFRDIELVCSNSYYTTSSTLSSLFVAFNQKSAAKSKIGQDLENVLDVKESFRSISSLSLRCTNVLTQDIVYRDLKFRVNFKPHGIRVHIPRPGAPCILWLPRTISLRLRIFTRSWGLVVNIFTVFFNVISPCLFKTLRQRIVWKCWLTCVPLFFNVILRWC